MFNIMFVVIIGIFIFTLAKKIAIWNKNNNSPKLSVDATVVSKRYDIIQHQHAIAADGTGAQGYHTTTSTVYYMNFLTESGVQMEFCVTARVYDLLSEGDVGRLSFQGTRYLDFEKKI